MMTTLSYKTCPAGGTPGGRPSEPPRWRCPPWENRIRILARDGPFSWELGLWRGCLDQARLGWLPRLPPTPEAGRADATSNSHGTDDPVTARSTA